MSDQHFLQMEDGVRLNYTQSGELGKPNLLFLNGWRQTAAQWSSQVQYFQKDFRVTTYDYRGHGESDKPTSGYTVPVLASDLNTLIHALDLKDITIIGHSLGGQMTWALWKFHPESRGRIIRFVSVDGSPCMLINPSWTEQESKDFGGVFTQGQLEEISNAFDSVMPAVIRGMFTDKTSEQDFAWVWEQITKMPSDAALALFKDLVSRDWREVLPQVKVPTLIIGGEASVLQQDTSRWMHTQIPGSKLHLFGKEKGGHFTFWEFPEAFNKVLDEFVHSG
ncbi:hypothetical protein PFICI_04787 [Pestalotiopsis fici W106-1]|uniref:AB hydrolase-1 domain-containing protein n=1 Tax=Pestalotiopsis fici (strain W106-1 / CGMCC3.15140) TaxID=1229662 RepID=W3XCK6_PESFW|nr:uncharacterized protein PFICI_04787 [Pestalotiopsis fici W106-1]ETS82911.1 hypothetical protein PFICI_04787 [Pestalotiopsis fici W106-1]